LIGDISGKEYTVSYIGNWIYQTSTNSTNTVNLHIFCEGKLVLLAHALYHWTVDADGYWHLEVSHGFTKVK